jgi:TP901 family phage tail tape measure protein
MGRSGEFEIRYDVLIDRLESQLRRGEEAVRASQGRMNAAGGLGTNLNLNRRQVASLDAITNSQKATTGAIREKRLAQQQATRAAERAIRTTENQKRVLSDSEKVLQHLGLALRRMILWWSTAAVILGAQRLSKEITQVVAAFQLVVKELTVLGTEGEQVYQRLATAAFDAAEATGRTFDEAADALRGWIRQGFNAIEAADLLRTTLIGLNLTQLTSTELVRTMTATMRAFNIPAADSISVIDKLIGVSRRYAIETGQLATGIRRFSASAKVANVTLDEQIGIMTAMMVRTQQSAQMVGRAGRTIFTRLRRNAVEALETIAKVQVFTDESRQSFRDLFEVLTDLAGTWKTLTQAEQEEIAFQAAGLRQREFFLALMEDFAVAQEANIESLGSVGLAYKSNALLVNTLSKSIVGLKTAWTGVLSQQSGILAFVSALVNGLRGILDVAVQIPEALIAIGAVLPALIAIGVGLFTAFSPTLLTTLIAAAGAITGLVYALGKLRSSDQKSIIQEAKELNDVMIQESVNARKLAEEFISLFEKQNSATDNTDLLIKAREGIDRLYPGLLKGEEDLFAVYGMLSTSLSEITQQTIKLTEARKELTRIELQEQEVKALGTIIENRSNPPDHRR